MTGRRLEDPTNPEAALRSWARRALNPQKGSPAHAMQWAVEEIDRLRAAVSGVRAVCIEADDERDGLADTAAIRDALPPADGAR